MQNFEILLDNRFTGSTQPINSGLQLQGDYLSYVTQNGGGIVNEFNVKGYLNDERNLQITNDFFTYLTGNTSQAQALNIISSNQKLATVFNDYYQRIILSATQIASTAVINQNLTGASQIIGSTYIHPWNGFAPSKQLTGITKDIYNSSNGVQSQPVWNEFTTEESYYIPVYIERGTNQLARYTYDLCDVLINRKTAGFYPDFSGITSAYFGASSISSFLSNLTPSNIALLNLSLNTPSNPNADTRIHTILDCFVDVNLETNENVNNPGAPLKVSFEFSNYSFTEGATVQVRVALSSPSTTGIEQAVVNLIPLNATLNVDFVPSITYPTTLSWNIGEQFKTLTFTASNDFLIEGTEGFSLQISNIINLNPGAILNANVNIVDTTILRKVSLSVGSPHIPFPLITGAKGVNINEGDVIALTITLDGPAFGVESISLQSAPTVNLPAGNLTVTASPTPGSDFIAPTTPVTFTFAPGEIQKTYIFQTLLDNQIEPDKAIIYQLFNPQSCILDTNQQVMEIFIKDTVQGGIVSGKKYVHLNFGKIYSVFGDGISNVLMRQINPQPGIGGGFNNISLGQYNYNLIEYNTPINFKDYNTPGNNDSIIYDNSKVKIKITNAGSIQSTVNNIPLSPGQNTIINVPSSDYIITATTNVGLNIISGFFEFANYKVELINNYSAVSTLAYPYTSMAYSMRGLNDLVDINKTINLGTFSLFGMTTLSNDTTNQYRLKSNYKNVNTARIASGGGFVCPVVGSFNFTVNFSDFYANTIEDVSILGIMFLNFNLSVNYNLSNYSTRYNTFEFVSGITNTALFYTCGQNNSIYNGLNYISLPFKTESVLNLGGGLGLGGGIIVGGGS